MYKDHCRWHQIKITVARARRSCSLSITVFLLFVFAIAYGLYEIQYKTGIELLPFIPIDDSGFDVYNEDLLSSVFSSESARRQPRRGSILCWVMTASLHHKTRVPAVNSTWLSRCDAAHFLTNNDRFLDESIPYHTVFKGLPDSYYKLFWKTRLALYYVYKNISSEFDWYYKADDDTYLVMDNLRRYLKDFDPDQPHYIGFRLKRRAPEHGYNAGGSGYALSRKAMELFADELFHDRIKCPYHEWEDYAVARCLGSLGIFATDSRDDRKRQRFLPWRPEQHYQGDLTKGFLMDDIEQKGPSVFHDNLVAMHHLSPDEIRLIDGMLYGVARGIYRREEDDNL